MNRKITLTRAADSRVSCENPAISGYGPARSQRSFTIPANYHAEPLPTRHRAGRNGVSDLCRDIFFA
jgi:hypothetical protein